MTYAITHAANAVVPVTWTSNGNVVTVQNWPTNFHAAYASDQHTATVVQLADAPRQAPQQAPDLSAGGGVAAGTLAAVVLGGAVWYSAKHKGARWGQLLLALCLGVTLANSVVGTTITGFLASGTNAVNGIFSHL